nr:CotH kinase family protein [bacterium]
VAGRLDKGNDRILLLDRCGNPGDGVHYCDGGRGPGAADGSGSSLELRNPWADNSAAEAWAASDEGRRTEWATYSYSGLAEPSAVGPDGTWEELVLGLLDSGEVLLDDLSVVENPETAPVELLRNGSFESGADSWRLLGTHRHSEVIPDPDDPGNRVLRLVATGPTEHMHNHAETTLISPISLQEYEISFRARWISGSNQLNSRLYFNRLPRTTLVEQPEVSGTPGERNSTYEENLGPAFADMRHSAPVPAPLEPVRVTITVDDPDGVEWVSLWSSVNGEPFTEQAMTELGSNRWEAWLEGQPASSVVQFYVEAEDGLEARATFPAAGPDSRALVQFDDGLAATNGLHNFRFIMTRADSDWMHQTENIMSNDLLGATVVYEEREVFYNVGVRTRGSMAGRPLVARLGYYVSFNSEQPFRDNLGSVILDRSEVSVGHGQREMFTNIMFTSAGSVSGEYNDLVQLLAPRREYTGTAELQLDRFTGLMLSSQFENGDEGNIYQYEMIYYPLSTNDGTPEGLKLPQPRRVVGTHIVDLGDDRESYRWNFLLESNERLDDFSGIMRLGQTFALTGPDFHHRVQAVIDVDQWLRAFAFCTLAGAVDQYGGAGSQHNAKFYVRAEDERVLFFPHDLDYYRESTLPVVNNRDLRHLLENPANRRAYYGHLYDIIQDSCNGEYMAHWRDQFAALVPHRDWAGYWRFVVDRVEFVMNGAPGAIMTQFPRRDFRVTTNGGTDFSVPGAEVLLEGEAWIDAHRIGLAGEAEPLDVTWVDGSTWQVTLPLEPGANEVSLVATDYRGAVVGRDTIIVTSTE